MAIYTKKGDKGKTGLLGGTRVDKDSPKVACYGTLDEANATLGIAYSLITDKRLKKEVRHIQKRLFSFASELASDEKGREFLEDKIQADDIARLEQVIDDIEGELGPLHDFIIPGDTTASATLHQARSIIRRAEREIVTLDNLETVRPELKKYINRLSDTIFMLARSEANGSFLEQVKLKVIEKLDQST